MKKEGTINGAIALEAAPPLVVLLESAVNPLYDKNKKFRRTGAGSDPP